ncbi:MAG: hypothetical protein SNJ78_03925, partial [Spirochaetales bacterium]
TACWGQQDSSSWGYDETCETYLERIAELTLRNRCRIILVAPPVAGVEIKKQLCTLWHRLTDPRQRAR